MARVPTYDVPQVQDAGAGKPVFLQTPDMPDVTSAQTQRLGQAMVGAGDAGARIAQDMQAQANQLRVDDAVNQAKEAAMKLTFDPQQGFTNLKGINALQRPDGKPLTQEYGDNLRAQFDSIAGGLGNDVQKQAFQRHAADMQTAFETSAMRHETEQYQNYTMSVREATINTRMNEIGLNYNNPEVIDQAITSIRAAVYDQSRMLGKSADWAEMQAQKMTSNAHKVALEAALQKNDIGYADAYLKKYSGQMEADDLLRTQGLITKEMDSRVAVGVATTAVKSTASRVAPTDVDRLTNIMWGTESNHQQFGKDGQPLISPAGAIGIAQVMPGTAPEAAKLAGLPWDDNRYRTDPKYNEALGRAYFQKQLQDFGGDPSKAMAAYNAGPGAVQNALKKAETAAKLSAADPSIKQLAWTDFLPKETRDYVAKNMGQYDSGAGVPTRPTLQDVHNSVLEQLGPNAKPSVVRAAKDEATRQFEDILKARKDQEEQGLRTALQTGFQNGYSVSSIPSSILAQVPPEKMQTLRDTLASMAKGDNVDNPKAYQKVMANPALMKDMSEDQWFNYSVTNFSQDTKKALDAERGKLISGNPLRHDSANLDTAAVRTGLDTRLRQLKIDPTPKDDGGEDAARIGAIRMFVDQQLRAAQQGAGKQFNETEVNQQLDGLFAKNVTLHNMFWANSSGPLLGTKVNDLDSATKDAIKTAYKKNGNDNPTDAQILQLYFQSQTTKRAP